MARLRKAAAAERSGRFKAMAAVAKTFDRAELLQARSVLRVVRAVPTRFVQFDHATGVRGLPVERFMLLHGESAGGKTACALGLMESFLRRDHFVLFIDSERTTPLPWAVTMMGEMVDHPGFRSMRPTSFEDAITKTQMFLNTIAEARAAGWLPDDTSGLVVVDSLRKLVPREVMKELLDADRRETDVKGGNNRRAQIQAKWNASWMDDLVPLLEHSGAGFIGVAREMEDPDADVWSRKYGTNYKVGGGSAIYYDSSLVLRVERAAWIQDGDGKERRVFGERHRVTIRKTKVAGKEDKQVASYFHVSNGVHIPPGFDRARDVLELGKRFGVVEHRGASWSHGGEKIAAGEHAAVKVLTEDVARLDRIEAEVREKFAEVAPLEHDADGVITEAS